MKVQIVQKGILRAAAQCHTVVASAGTLTTSSSRSPMLCCSSDRNAAETMSEYSLAEAVKRAACLPTHLAAQIQRTRARASPHSASTAKHQTMQWRQSMRGALPPLPPVRALQQPFGTCPLGLRGHGRRLVNHIREFETAAITHLDTGRTALV